MESEKCNTTSARATYKSGFPVYSLFAHIAKLDYITRAQRDGTPNHPCDRSRVHIIFYTLYCVSFHGRKYNYFLYVFDTALHTYLLWNSVSFVDWKNRIKLFRVSRPHLDFDTCTCDINTFFKYKNKVLTNSICCLARNTI